MQPVDRFDVDAAILFSDILLPLTPMGMELRFEEGRGPVFDRPLADAAAIEALNPLVPERDLAFVGEALARVRERLAPTKALLGFAGAPFTLAAYAVEGGTPGAAARLRWLMYRQTQDFEALMSKLADAVGAHLRYQIESGAQAVVLFDTWAGQLTRDDYLRYVAPWSRRVLDIVGDAAPRMAFVRDGDHLLESVVDLGFDAVALDWRTPLDQAFERVGGRVALQGNLDPAVLLATPEEVSARVRAMLAAVAGRPGWIASLGHGVLKQTDPECVAAFVDAVREAATEPQTS
jgi:uroporphyrinogen decarboxylase